MTFKEIVQKLRSTRIFYLMCLLVLVWALLVFGYDLFQGQIAREEGRGRIIYDPQTITFTFEKPAGTVEIVYASMFGPGEPVMAVRDKWITEFEKEYSVRLSLQATKEFPAKEKVTARDLVMRNLEYLSPEAAQRIQYVKASNSEDEMARELLGLERWLLQHGVELAYPPGTESTPDKLLAAIALCFGGMENVRPERIDVKAHVDVKVERRWQGRWVLSANRPRFLTGREVPDILVGSKMEVLALVQDGYAVPLDKPLPGETVSPLDGPDTWGDPSRSWREAFIPAMLEQGKYTFLPDPELNQHVFLPPTWCNTNCIFYNRALFRKAGIEKVPQTWPEFIDVCEKLKAAGIPPLTADAHVYADMWMVWLIFRAVGPETWEDTITGVPRDRPPRERRSDPPWTDERYAKIFAEIRRLRDNGYFKKGFAGLTWPASQRGFASGDAAMMICGSWLPQELGGYKDIETKGDFELGCFSFPTWPGGREIDQKAAQASPYGLMVCRQGKATKHAVELVKYLSAKDHVDMVHQNAQISCMKDADFPPALAEIADDFKNAPAIYERSPNIYARRFNASILMPLYQRFFIAEKGDTDYMTVEKFLKTLDEETKRYLAGGGEEGFE